MSDRVPVRATYNVDRKVFTEFFAGTDDGESSKEYRREDYKSTKLWSFVLMGVVMLRAAPHIKSEERIVDGDLIWFMEPLP